MDLYVLRFPEFKNSIFSGWSIRVYLVSGQHIYMYIYIYSTLVCYVVTNDYPIPDISFFSPFFFFAYKFPVLEEPLFISLVVNPILFTDVSYPFTIKSVFLQFPVSEVKRKREKRKE